MEKLIKKTASVMSSITLAAILLCSENFTAFAAGNDSGSSNTPKWIIVIVMIAVFLAATALSAFLTYHIRKKKIAQLKDASSESSQKDISSQDEV